MAENSSQDTQALLQPGIQRFARSISGQPIGLAKYAPEPWGNIRLCFENASRKATESGGQARFGWMFQHKLVAAVPGPGYLIAIHHAVWQAPTGYLYDVTPLHTDPKHHPLAIGRDTLFLVDDLALPVRSDRILAPRPSKFLALDEDTSLLAHVEQLRLAEDVECRSLYAAAERPPR